MPMIDEVLQRIEARDSELEAMSAEDCREAAALLRDAKPGLESQRQQELADELAEQFEERAVERSRSS